MNARKLFFGIKLCLIAVLALVVLAVVIIPAKSQIPNSASGNSTGSVNTGNPANRNALTSDDYTQIVERNPFYNSSTQINIPTADNPGNSVSEQLKLALIGTVSGSKSISRAIIKDTNTGRCQSYKINQTVKGAVLKDIDENSVTLFYEGEKITLHLNTTSQENSNVLWPVGLNDKNSVEHNPTSTPSGQNPPAYNKFQPLNTILRSAVIKPHIVKGRAEGLSLSGLEDIEAARKLGLKNGDVIRSVNGHILINKQQAFQVMKKAKNVQSVNIELVRDNRTKQLSFDL